MGLPGFGLAGSESPCQGEDPGSVPGHFFPCWQLFIEPSTGFFEIDVVDGTRFWLKCSNYNCKLSYFKANKYFFYITSTPTKAL